MRAIPRCTQDDSPQWLPIRLILRRSWGDASLRLE